MRMKVGGLVTWQSDAAISYSVAVPDLWGFT